jgi:hypothetical protein
LPPTAISFDEPQMSHVFIDYWGNVVDNFPTDRSSPYPMNDEQEEIVTWRQTLVCAIWSYFVRYNKIKK